MEQNKAREQARKAINERPLTDFISLDKSKNGGRDMYNCPVCGSGTGRNKTGALRLFRDSNRVQCFAGGCFTDRGEDTLGALRIIWHCDEAEAIRRAGYSLETGSNQENTKNKESHESKPDADFTSFYRECHKALKNSPEALEYLHGRGITDESIERFNLGYCASWKHSKAPDKAPATKRIIIPRTTRTYTARRIDEPANEYEKAFVKQIEGRQKDLFNLGALEEAETLFICEGELDAISLYQLGASAVIAIGTITNTKQILEQAKEENEKIYILALDNDEEKEDGSRPGFDAQKKLAQDMKAAGITILQTDPRKFYSDAKDANEALLKNPERMKTLIAELEAIAQQRKQERDEAREEELRKRTGAGMLESFLQEINTRKYEPIPTGIIDLDRALQGGFIRGTLVMLGAPPAMGKTALAQWIFENMASGGIDCLYINLEMSREQLIARSLARIAWKESKADISPLDVLRGYSWTEEQRKAITNAAGIYNGTIAQHFIYNPEGVTNAADSVLTVMKAEAARLKAQGKPAPVVCVDYLQLIDSGERDAIEGLKNVIFRLKEFAKDNDTVVFVIMANNRTSNKTGTVELESGRDTSAIEYSGDVMLGLSYTAIEDRRKYESGTNGKGEPIYSEYDLDAIRRLKREAREAGQPVPPVCNEVSVKVMKNRFGEDERRANLIFDGKHNTFMLKAYESEERTAGGWTVIRGKSPFDE